MTLEALFEKFDLFAEAPNAVAKMRKLVLELAVQGKLVEQRPTEMPATACIQKADKPLTDIAILETLETPAGWVLLPLGCLIAANVGGGTPSKQNPDYWGGPIPWASVKDVQDKKYLVSTIDSITEEGLRCSSSNLIPANWLIVVTRMGLGKLAINKTPIAINQDLRAIKPTGALNLDFAYLLFKSLKLIGSGVTVKGITVEKLHAMPVVLPPFEEQKRIVAKVDELMVICDRLDALRQERGTRHTAIVLAALDRFAKSPTSENLNLIFHKSYDIAPGDLRKAILALAVQGKLVSQDPKDEPAEIMLRKIEMEKKRISARGELKADKKAWVNSPAEPPHNIPESWCWVRLQEVFEISRGGSPRPAGDPRFFGGKIPWITVGEITKDFGKYLTRTATGLTEEGSRHSRFINPGDLLLTNSGATLGVPKISKIRGCMNDGVAVLRLFHSFDLNDFGYLYLTHQTAAFRNVNQGMGQPNLNTPIIAGWFFPLPPLAEQRRIVAKADELMTLVNHLESQLVASRATADNLLEAVVAELTTEQVRVDLHI
jgi:type I restriction enzyme S subunit